MLEFIKQPWHWAVAGILIGLTVPTLLIIGNKPFGLSSNLRHICAACLPANIDFFKYNWRKEAWNLYFALGIILGGFIAHSFLQNGESLILADTTKADLMALGITNFDGLLPSQIFGIDNFLSAKGFIFCILGGFFVGFGTRYANGCTSGHAINGLSNLSWVSLVATCTFMAAGIIMTHLIFPSLFNYLF